MTDSVRTVHRACNLCEAICGLDITVDGPRILSIRGDDADPFSRGHICPKGVALQDIHEDPNRLRRPMQKVDGTWVEISWDEAFDLAADRLSSLAKQHGDHTLSLYAGNPSVHNIGTALGTAPLARLLRSRNVFSATSVDQLPQQLTSLLMYGHQFLIPIPDIDRTDYFLIMGGNPVASNGSLMTAPDVTQRLKDIRARGGRIVVLDPRFTETAAIASEHHFLRPASDAAFLMAALNTIRSENLMRLERPERLQGLDAAFDAIATMTPELAAGHTGIDAETIRRLARELASAPSAVCYGRVGSSLQAFGTLNQWLIQLLNLVTGNLDRAGGALLTQPLIPLTGPGTRAGGYARWTSRVRGLPESGGELPVAVLAEEILTPGDGQIRGLITIAGNPVLSTPDGRQLDEALDSLEFMVSIDIYLNETTRHADLILPPTSSLHHDHYDLVFNAFAIRNVARFNSAIWPRPDDERYDWEIFGELCARLAQRLEREHRPIPSTAKAIAKRLQGKSIDDLLAAPHGLDLGPLQPSLYERLETSDRAIDCAPAVLLADVTRFLDQTPAPPSSFQLIGRRHLRSNNSWMHNSQRLIKGKRRDQLLMHPDDLASLGLTDGQAVEVRAQSRTVTIPVQASDTMMRGVVSLPHGFGHNREGTRLGLAEENAGVSYNDLTDALAVDAVSGNAAMNGVWVSVVGSR